MQNLCCPAFHCQSSMLNRVSKLKAHHVILCCLQECVCVCVRCVSAQVEQWSRCVSIPIHVCAPTCLSTSTGVPEPPGKNRYAFIIATSISARHLRATQQASKKTDDGDGISGNQKKIKTFAFHVRLPGQQPQHFNLPAASLVGSDNVIPSIFYECPYYCRTLLVL